jgi:hypothetical protein
MMIAASIWGLSILRICAGTRPFSSETTLDSPSQVIVPLVPMSNISETAAVDTSKQKPPWLGGGFPPQHHRVKAWPSDREVADKPSLTGGAHYPRVAPSGLSCVA